MQAGLWVWGSATWAPLGGPSDAGAPLILNGRGLNKMKIDVLTCGRVRTCDLHALVTQLQ